MARERASKHDTGAEVPQPGNPDRKRVLNVLAQRRYRQRKRQKLVTLQEQLDATQSQLQQKRGVESSNLLTPSTLENASPIPLDNQQTSVSSETTFNCLDPPAFRTPIDLVDQFVVPNSDRLSFTGVSGSANLPTLWGAPGTDSNFVTTQPDESFLDFSLNGFSSEDLSHQISPQYGLPNMLTRRSPLDTSTQTASRSRLTPEYPCAFADDALIDLPIVKVIQAGAEIATMLNCTDTVWDPTALRVLIPEPSQRLPPCFQPTEAQQRIPHHPFIDILPWPSVRSKLCQVFAMPKAARPPVARGDIGAVAIAWDIDDESEGVRIVGADEFDVNNWEIGQTFFKNWWWALDREIVENSNRLRLNRGAPRLMLQAP